MNSPGKFKAVMRRYAYGLVQLSMDLIGLLPSQHLRRWLFTGIFGLSMPSDSVMFRECKLRAPWRIRIGSGCAIGGASELDGRGSITIGDRVNLSTQVMLWTAQHDHRDAAFATTLKPIVIEDYVWIGPRVIVLPGVVIKAGCVIGAASVVTKDTEPYGIYAGIPAQRIGERRRDLNYEPACNYTPFI